MHDVRGQQMETAEHKCKIHKSIKVYLRKLHTLAVNDL